MRTVFLSLSFFLFALPFAAADTGDLCHRDQSHVDGTLQITGPGLVKLVRNVTNNQLPQIAEVLRGMHFKPVVVGPDREACAKAKFDKMSLSDEWANCYGMPAILSGATLQDIAKPIPSDFAISDLYLNDIQFGQIKEAPCDADGSLVTDAKSFPKQACFDIPIPKLVFGGSLNVKSQRDGSTLFGMKKWRLDLTQLKDADGNELVPSARIKAVFDESGQVKNLLQIDNNFSKATIPPGSLSASLDLSPAEQEKLDEQVLAGAYEELRPTLHLPVASTSKERYDALAKIDGDTWKKQTDLISNAIVKQMQSKFGANFSDSNSLALFLLSKNFIDDWNANVVHDKDPDDPSKLILTVAMNKIAEKVNNNLMPMIGVAINNQLQELAFLNHEVPVIMPPFNLQDAVDASKIAASTQQRLNAALAYEANISKIAANADLSQLSLSKDETGFTLKNYLAAFSQAKTDYPYTQLNQLRNEWLQAKTLLRNKVDELVQSKTIDPDLGEKIYKQESDKLDKLADSLTAQMDQISQRESTIMDPYFMRVLGGQVVNAQDAIDLALSVCTACSASDANPVDPASLAPFHPKTNYDVAVQVSFANLNNILRLLQIHKAFSLCMVSNPVNTCSNAGLLSLQKHSDIDAAPQIGRDANGLYIESPKVAYGASLLDLKTSVRAYIDLVPCNGGDICAQEKNVKSGDHILQALIPKEELNTVLQGAGLHLPFSLKAQQVDVNDNSISVYGLFQNKDNTITRN